MTDTDAGFMMEYVPPLSERIWRWFGFRRAFQIRPEETAEFPSYIVANVRIGVSFTDRLRILIAGKLGHLRCVLCELAVGLLRMKIADWLSERILFGSLIIVGYLIVCIVGATGVLSTAGESVVHDAMLGLGPIVGLIAAAIWKADKADKQNAQTMSTLADAVAAQPIAPLAQLIQPKDPLS